MRRVGTCDLGTMWLGFVVLSLASLLSAQEPSGSDGARAGTDWVGKLADPDPGVVEDACRRLLIGPKQQVTAKALSPLLSSRVSATRWAAARLLLHHGLGREALRQYLMLKPKKGKGARSDGATAAGALRAELVTVASVEDLSRLRKADRSDLLRIAAIRELADRELLSDDLVIALLSDENDAIGEEVARILVEERPTFSVALARRAEAVNYGLGRLCQALAQRPRAAAATWIREFLKEGEPSLEEQLWAFAALGPDGIEIEDAKLILLACAGADLRSAALHAADQMSSKVADRLVPELHRLCLDGSSAASMLDCLDRLSPKGERHLLGLARALPAKPREEIADWLTTRSSQAVSTLVEAALNGSFELEPYLLRRSAEFLQKETYREVVLDLLMRGTPAQAVAAFSALVDSEVYDPRMLSYALDDEDEKVRRMRRLLQLPFHRLPVSLYVTMLEHEDVALVSVVLASLRPGPMVLGLEPQLVKLSQDLDSAVGRRATQKLFAAGRSQIVIDLFQRMDATARQRLLGAFRTRREPWVRELLNRDDSIASLHTRMFMGDEAVLAALLADPRSWPLRWLHRCDELVPKQLSAADLPLFNRHLVTVPIDEQRRAVLVGWLAQRPDLACGALLTQVYEKDSDEEVRYEALRGLLGRAEGAKIRADCRERFASGLSEVDKDLAYEVVGAMAVPLRPVDAEFLAELLLVVPLADPVAESLLHRANSGIVRTPDLPLLNMFWQLVRRGIGEGAAEQVSEVAAKALVHPSRHALGRRRLGGLLVLFARDESMRVSLAPAIARLIVASPDHAPEYLGPAHLILGESAQRAEDWSRAAAAYSAAVRAFARTPPRPTVVRTMLGENLQGDGQLPMAWLAALPYECRIRAALAAGDKAEAKRWLNPARSLAYGDREALRVLGVLQREIDR